VRIAEERLWRPASFSVPKCNVNTTANPPPTHTNTLQALSKTVWYRYLPILEFMTLAEFRKNKITKRHGGADTEILMFMTLAGNRNK
jgi:hypothetical protein